MNVTFTPSPVTICYLSILSYLTTSDGVPISKINHTCSTTCRYWPPVIQTIGKWSITGSLKTLSPCQYFFFLTSETLQSSTTCTWTWHDELLSYTDFQALFNWFKIILLVDSSVIMGSHQPLLLWYLVFHMQGLILGPHLFLILLTITISTKCFYISNTWQPSCHLYWWYFILLPYIISCRLQADINSLTNQKHIRADASVVSST